MLYLQAKNKMWIRLAVCKIKDGKNKFVKLITIKDNP